jgi:hydroxymethylbilane synthase
MRSKTLRIATRESRLAMRQTEMVAAALRGRYPATAIEIVGMTTRGDQVLDRPLASAGGKGLFVKELEVAMLEGRADIAVHSMKDVPMVLPAQFALVTHGPREVPFDAFVSNRHETPATLAPGAVVGTSSLRRECQLRHAWPDLQVRLLRGNVLTRLAKLDAGEYEAIILAAAGLRRLDLEGRIRSTLPEAQSLPAIAQGILAIEHRADRPEIGAMLQPFEDRDTATAARAERSFGLVVEGSCEVPLGALARASGDSVEMEGFIGLPDGTRLIRRHAIGKAADAEKIGAQLGREILAAGGREILDTLARSTQA